MTKRLPPTARKTNARLSDEAKRMALNMRARGFNAREIAEIVEAGHAQVRKFFQRHAAHHGLPPKPIVKKRLTSGRVGIAIKRIVQQCPWITLSDICKVLHEQYPTEKRLPKKSTIWAFLQRNRLVRKKLRYGQMISTANKKKRLDFARNYKDKDGSWYRRIIWSDETMVETIPTRRGIYHRVHSDTKSEDMPRNLQVQGGGVKVMFWGCFSAHGYGPLVPLPAGSITADTYVDLLRHHLLPYINALEAEIEAPVIFMQDNAAIHKARKVLDFLDENGVQVLDWPAQSPDLNPIENLWAIAKGKMKKNRDRMTRKDHVIAGMEAAWGALEATWCETLAMSAKKRLKRVVLKKGGHI